MNKYFQLIINVFLLQCVTSNIYAQDTYKLIDKVQIGDSHTRYYLHFDKLGNPPPQLPPDRLKNNIFPGDEIVIRFYPNILFSLDAEKIIDEEFKKKNTKDGFIIFPFNQKDVYSIQSGLGAVYFATKEKGKFNLRISKDSARVNLGQEVKITEIKELSNNKPRKLNAFSKVLQTNGFDDDWDVWTFENISFEKGDYFIEVFQVSPNVALLLDRVHIEIKEVYQNVFLINYRDLSKINYLPMEMKPEYSFFEGTLSGLQTSTFGILNLNIIYDYSKDSWFFRQAPSASKNQKLKFMDLQIVIDKERELPSSLRTRAGFAVFNDAREARLISNFVFVLSPESYFTNSTSFFDRINPTLGIQIGGTGAQDVIVLMGLSLKIINEGDIIVGLRFGKEPDSPWVLNKNFYFGISLDPGLFNQLNKNH